jgi:hypothetical protein
MSWILIKCSSSKGKTRVTNVMRAALSMKILMIPCEARSKLQDERYARLRTLRLVTPADLSARLVVHNLYHTNPDFTVRLVVSMYMRVTDLSCTWKY